MKQSLLIPAFLLTIGLAGWELAYAQAPDTTGAAPGTPGTTTSTTTTTTTTPSGDASSTTTTTTNTPATPPSAAYLAARERGKGVTAKETTTIDKDLTTVAKGVDDKAAKDGDATVAGRLASDFGVSSDALLAEKAKYNVGWGDLMIAHTLGSNTLTGVTVDEILIMRTTDAMGWGGIASSSSATS
jgi:cytoskeletal protein RodZ